MTDSADQGVCTVDADGRLLNMNPMAEQILGWTEAEVVGESLHELSHSRRPDGSILLEHDCPIFRAGRSGESACVEHDSFMRRDGIHIPVSYVATPFGAPDGVGGTILVFSDCTVRRAALLAAEQELESAAMAAIVRHARDERRLVLHAQPILDLATDEIVRHELLLRLRDREGTLIEPGSFLPAAERHGLIADIDRWVIRQGAELAGRGHPVELNIAAESLGPSQLLNIVRSELLRNGADPALMVFELTETALLRRDEPSEQFIDGIVELGCGLALGDFGTGSGGLTYLERFPVNHLKIDIEFVRDLPRDVGSQQIVRAIVSLARGFGQRTVAEGVEDAETLVLLREYGVDYAQGYHLGRPAPLNATFDELSSTPQ